MQRRRAQLDTELEAGRAVAAERLELALRHIRQGQAVVGTLQQERVARLDRRDPPVLSRSLGCDVVGALCRLDVGGQVRGRGQLA